MTLFKRQVISLTVLVCSVVSAITAQQLYSSYSTLKYQHIITSQADINRALVILPQAFTKLNAPIVSENQEKKLSIIINQLFPKTNYSQISLTSTDAYQLVRQDNIIPTTHSPNWFQHLFKIPSHTEQRIIEHNDQSLGLLTITAQPILNYQQLWQISTHTVLANIIIAIISSLLVYFICSKNHATLARLTLRAKTIENLNQAPLSIPNESDLAIIVRAFNKICYQLDANFKNQADEAMKLRQQAYLDNISGLGNRSFFIHQLSSWLNESYKGGLGLIQTDLINECYQNEGFKKGDELVKTIATRLNEVLTFNDVTLARLSKDEFAILIPNISIEKLKICSKSLINVFNDLSTNTINDNVAIGLVFNENKSTPSQILTQLDNALTQAKIMPNESMAIIKDINNQITLGKQQWKALLEEAISEDLFIYKYQPATLSNGINYHYEVFTAIKKNNNYYSAGMFLGAIEDLKIGSWFDRHVIVAIINKLNADRTIGPFAINITNSCINDPSFIRWLDNLLQKNTLLSSRLFFEIQEISCIKHPDATGILCSIIRKYDFGFGIDNYGRNFQSLTYLKELQPNYVKIDYVYTHQLNDQTKSAVLSSICRTAHSLNIKVIATRVETETQLERLSELFVGGYQGFITEKQSQPA
ncbi:EAL domain-containing protein [Photobacterium carnosum]|uniref:bifunctional diguanylate cyclase/phosphodiesterase n=1 Tax=Photobacterium carnosum TaxID=2023717 RepID=UPI001C900BDF|nr:EAL domain-containing protein [Photobacterium carnosum]MBY3787594.1 EAL domain-containing protein [Photobacterium carnosum]MCD9516701.1 EAL domain-containing protein [Photobacterium carnosum]MCD9521651.1 EAL domain-containing protein [Photobacterium carnosum]MCD9532224.1 EAL domain-containing protein [Photobacterium carnosum]MCD9536101.1 EAL domain-containing protein [Photobacterium carnosum]